VHSLAPGLPDGLGSAKGRQAFCAAIETAGGDSSPLLSRAPPVLPRTTISRVSFPLSARPRLEPWWIVAPALAARRPPGSAAGVQRSRLVPGSSLGWCRRAALLWGKAVRLGVSLDVPYPLLTIRGAGEARSRSLPSPRGGPPRPCRGQVRRTRPWRRDRPRHSTPSAHAKPHRGGSGQRDGAPWMRVYHPSALARAAPLPEHAYRPTDFAPRGSRPTPR
jgi:hypothetical protein